MPEKILALVGLRRDRSYLESRLALRGVEAQALSPDTANATGGNVASLMA